MYSKYGSISDGGDGDGDGDGVSDGDGDGMNVVVVVGMYAVVVGVDDTVLVAMVMDVALSQNMEMFVGKMKSSLLPPNKTEF